MVKRCSLKLPFSEKKYRMAEALAVAGVTYRQVDSWESAGALRLHRGSRRGWRHLSLADIFRLRIMKELRGLGLSVTRAGRVMAILDELPIVNCAIAYAKSGYNMFLVTDAHEFAKIDIDHNIAEFFPHIQSKAKGVFLVPLSGFLRKALPKLGIDVMDKQARLRPEWEMWTPHGWTLITTPDSDSEARVLNLIRSGDYSQVEVEVKDRAIVRIKATGDVSNWSPIEGLVENLRQHGNHIALRVVTRNGALAYAEIEKAEKG